MALATAHSGGVLFSATAHTISYSPFSQFIFDTVARHVA